MKPIIELIYDEPKFEIDVDNMIYKAVQNIGVNVDKERLVEALRYSRSFYDEGYETAKRKYERKWIPIGQYPPEPCLLCFENGEMVVGHYDYDFGGWQIQTSDEFYTDLDDDENEPVAWMPLPRPYEEK